MTAQLMEERSEKHKLLPELIPLRERSEHYGINDVLFNIVTEPVW